MATITFSDYIASRPTATTPVGSSDRILILQDGVVKLVASENTGYQGAEAVLINASATPITILPASGEVIYKKIDSSVDVATFNVSVVGQTMCQELQNGLSTEGETLRVKLIGTKWYKIA